MKETVYIDVVFAENLAMDFLILAALNRIFLLGGRRRSVFFGALLGSLWACLVSVFGQYLAGLELLGTWILIPALMVRLAFGFCGWKNLGRNILSLHAIALLLGGAVTAIYLHTGIGYCLEVLIRGGRVLGIRLPAWLFVMAGAYFGIRALLFSLVRLAQGRMAGQTFCKVRLGLGEEEVCLTALFDTGNCLKDPIRRRPVHIVEAGALFGLTGRVKGVIYVPYQAVGTKNGVLPAVCLDWMEVTTDERRYYFEQPLVALIREPLSPQGRYRMLLQGEQWKNAGGKTYDHQSIHTQSFSISDSGALSDAADARAE